jgi:hypothetical protein
MGIAYNSSIVTSGLVLAFDVANGIKNATGNISTNLIQNGNFVNGAGSPQESDSSATNTIIELANPGNSPFVLRQNGNNTEYQFNVDSGMIANTTYVMSGWYAKSSDYDGGDTMFHARAFSSSGAHNATGVDTGTLIYSTVVNSITWQFRYQTITTPADFSGAFDWYTGYGTNNTTGYRYYTNLRLEKGTYPSLYNLLGTGNNGEVQNGVSYNSANGGSLSFDGVDDYITVPDNSNLDLSGDKTLSCWVYMGADTGGCGIAGKMSSSVGGMALAYGWSGNGFQAIAWNSANSPYLIKDATRDINKWVYLTSVQSDSTRWIYAWDSFGLRSSSYSGGTHSWDNNVGFYVGCQASLSNFVPANTRIAQVSIYNRALSAAEIQQNFNALKGRFKPEYETLTYTASGNLTVTGNGTNTVNIFKTSGGNDWDNQAYSLVPFTAPCTIEFNKQAASGDNGVSYAMIGWNADPTTNASYATIDYASYPYSTSNYQVYHNGSLVQSGGTWNTANKFYIVYGTDGVMRHYNGSTLLYSVNYGTGNTVYVDSSFYSPNATFGGFSNIKVIRSAWNGTDYV